MRGRVTLWGASFVLLWAGLEWNWVNAGDAIGVALDCCVGVFSFWMAFGWHSFHWSASSSFIHFRGGSVHRNAYDRHQMYPLFNDQPCLMTNPLVGLQLLVPTANFSFGWLFLVVGPHFLYGFGCLGRIFSSLWSDINFGGCGRCLCRRANAGMQMRSSVTHPKAKYEVRREELFLMLASNTIQ